MKRIIKCPKCESKLAVFDIGKPISQKCPKCGNAFVVESEENKTEAPKPVASEAVTTGQAPEPASTAAAPAADAPKEDKAAAAPAPAQNEPSAAKKNGKKKTAPVPETAVVAPAAPSAAPAVTPAPAAEAKKDAAPAAAPAPADDKKDAAPKEIKVKKPEESPAFASKARTPVKSSLPSSDTPEAPELPVAGGHSPLFNALVVGMLLIIIVLQVFAQKQSNKQYGKLIEHLQFIETKMGK